MNSYWAYKKGPSLALADFHEPKPLFLNGFYLDIPDPLVTKPTRLSFLGVERGGVFFCSCVCIINLKVSPVFRVAFFGHARLDAPQSIGIAENTPEVDGPQALHGGRWRVGGQFLQYFLSWPNLVLVYKYILLQSWQSCFGLERPILKLGSTVSIKNNLLESHAFRRVSQVGARF